ncbi:MAG: putative lipoprotein [uncultured Caballeronia sp.]|nr:MAG: putative lipoprotein [uncultured Caballeronia sp.]
MDKWRRGVVLLAGAVVCTAACAATTATNAIAAGPAGQDSSSASGNALGDASARRGLLTNDAADEPQAPGNGSITELQQMIRDGKAIEMRATYNGSYGANMLFYPDQMTYYVALFQQKKFWRVIKTQTDTRAEAVYADFAKTTAQLADSEIRREKLQAENALADRLIALQQNRANRLQADVDVARAAGRGSS